MMYLTTSGNHQVNPKSTNKGEGESKWNGDNKKNIKKQWNKILVFCKNKQGQKTLSLRKERKDGGVKVIKLEMKRGHIPLKSEIITTKWQKYTYCLCNKRIHKHEPWETTKV